MHHPLRRLSEIDRSDNSKMERVAVWVVAAPVGALFAMAGVGHFTKYDAFLGIMKGMPFPAAHPAAVYVSGVVEFVCGTGLVLAPLVAGPAAASKVASALFCLVVAVTPANINSYMNDIPFGKSHLSYGWVNELSFLPCMGTTFFVDPAVLHALSCTLLSRL
jgi:uncharacterized membrane protein